MNETNMIGFVKLLEGKVSKLERRVLLHKIQELESKIGILETKLNPKTPEVAEKFVMKILEQYGNLVTSMSKTMESKCPNGFMDKDDFTQEALEYMVKWCLPKSKEFSTKTFVWIPYVKRSLQNCFVNIMKKTTAYDRKPEVLIGNFSEGTEPYESTVNVEEEYEYEELVSRVADALSLRDRNIFHNILKPPPALQTFINLKKGLSITKQSTRQLLAEFYGLPLSTINSVFITFKKTIQKCAIEVES